MYDTPIPTINYVMVTITASVLAYATMMDNKNEKEDVSPTNDIPTLVEPEPETETETETETEPEPEKPIILSAIGGKHTKKNKNTKRKSSNKKKMNNKTRSKTSRK